MNDNKVYVKIGRKYHDAFLSICDLVNRGGIDHSIIKSCRENRWIETEQYIFEYTGDVEAIDTGMQLGMTPSGASWFMDFRGNKSDNVMGAWHNLIELVSTNYHKEYSLVEYIQPSPLKEEKALDEYVKLLTRVMCGLQIPRVKVVPAPQEESVEDVYEVSMRLELFNGVGEPRPLLCKVYFRKRNQSFVPIRTNDARGMEEHISHLVETRVQNGVSSAENSETEIVDNVLNSVSKLIAGELQYDFSQSILVTNPTDEQTLLDFASNDSQDEVRLECKKLKVLSISHVQWYDTVFSIFIDECKAYRARIGANNSINLYCWCNEGQDKLIENNIISCVSPQTGDITEICLNTNREDLGLNSAQLEMIQKQSAFADHNFLISCSELVRRNVECSRYRCKNNTIPFDVDGTIRYKCADCPYPEVVYRYPDGKTAYTPLLNFDTLTLDVVEEPVETCRFCGRSYKRDNLNAEFLCSFCEFATTALENNLVEKEHRRNYRRYSGMIPLRKRVFLVGKKYCFENADRLCFVLGKNKYFFDKLKLKDSGLIDKPEKRQ